MPIYKMRSEDISTGECATGKLLAVKLHFGNACIHNSDIHNSDIHCRIILVKGRKGIQSYVHWYII